MTRFLPVLAVAAVSIVAIIATAMLDSNREPPPLKRCAAALAVLHAEADCIAIPNGGCTMTLGDLERVEDAGAEKQNYCPVDYSDGSGNR